ncbi:MAG: PD40 domain-containing protein [Flavobacteriales bacterium]|nr:PD40 domain-containing protein [Flavobacteriales bacterium]
MAAYLRISLFVLLAMAATVGYGQRGARAHTNYADRYYQQMAYRAAADEYLVAAKMGAVNEHVTKRLADCYMKLGDTENAEVWYAQVVKFLNREPKDMLNYAQALKGNGRYAEAEEWMDRYLATTRPEGAGLRSNISDFARKFTQNMDRFTVRSVSANTPYSDMGTSWGPDGQVYLASTRGETVGVKRHAAWNGQPFLDLYVADRQSTGDLINARLLTGGVRSRQHDGPAASVSGDQLWFTRSNTTRSKSGVLRLSIQRVRLRNGEWSAPEPFLYNNTECSVAQPAISPDGRYLVFVSDMPGGQGGTDLYICRDVGGQWGEPENMGPVINTALDEGFPFIGADGTLYFASNGHPGLGGLDIQAAPRSREGAYEVVINVGAPVNGPKDDFAFIIDAAGKTGYFSSNRPGGQGDDDIYAFVMNSPIEQRFLCTGVVYDDDAELPVVDVEVQLLDEAGKLVESTRTDAKGKYMFAVEKGRVYRVVARMKGRFDGEQFLSTERIEQEQIVARDIHLVPDAGVWLRAVARTADRKGFIEGMTVNVVNLSSFQSDVRTTGAGGDVNMRLQPNEQFEVLFEKAGFFSVSVPVSTVGMRQGIVDLNTTRELVFEEVAVGRPIPFKRVRWTASGGLDPMSKAELDAVAERVLVNPTMVFEVYVHDDARGDAATSLRTTQRQADAVVDYLRGKGVPKDRVVAKGYGQTKLLNHCGPGVQCTEEEHAENRRAGYMVTGFTAQ